MLDHVECWLLLSERPIHAAGARLNPKASDAAAAVESRAIHAKRRSAPCPSASQANSVSRAARLKAVPTKAMWVPTVGDASAGVHGESSGRSTNVQS